MEKMNSHQNQMALPSTVKPSALAGVMRFAAKATIGISLVVAGAALAQNVGLGSGTPDLKRVDETVTAAPPKIDINETQAPGAKREAIACSKDIATYCAPQTETRRNVRQCMADKTSLISQSCKAYLERVADDEAE